MIIIHGLFNLSRAYCVEICSWLVPLTLITTVNTLVSIGCPESLWRGRLSALSACLLAGIMVLHVTSWFVIGVVKAPTFVLTGLACLCFGINSWAIKHPTSMLQVLAFWRSPS